MRTALLTYLFAAAASAVLAQADVATYHVHPDGDDGAVGTSAEEAFATIARGLAALAPGDTLYLGDGVYREADLVVEGLRATAERPTVIKSVKRWGAKVEGVVYHTVLFKVLDCAHLVLDGLEVYHPGDTYDTDWSTGIETFGSDFVTVRNCYAHDCGCGGFGGRTGDYLTFENNVAVGNAMTSPYNCSGISIYHPRQLDDAPGPHIVVRDNVVFGNACPIPFSVAGFSVPTDGNGIILDDYANAQPDIDPDGSANPAFRAESLVEGNLAFGNGGAGIKTYRAGNVTLRRNTAYHNNYILAAYSGTMAEIGFEDATGPIRLEGNVGVAAFGRGTNALYYAPSAGDGATASLAAKRNAFVGPVVLRGAAALPPEANAVVPVHRQSYPAFANPRDTATQFASAADLRPGFRPRPGSPLIENAREPIGALAEPLSFRSPLPPDPTPRYRVPRADQAPAIDGVREGFYTAAPAPITGPDGTRLGSSGWWAAYVSDRLYLYAEISDDAGVDGLSLDLSGLGESGGVGGLVGFAGAPVVDDEREVASRALPSGGSAVEVALPLANLLPDGATAGDTLMLSVGPGVVTPLGDDGEEGTRLAGTSSETYRLDLAAAAPLPVVPRVASAAALWTAGVDDDAALPIARDLEGSGPAPADLSGSWRAGYDADSLYLRIDVRDDSLGADGGEAWYNDDAVEVYLDADNAKTFMDFDPNDYHLVVQRDRGVRDVRERLGPGATARIAERPGGYSVELALPWSAIGGEPTPGRFLGIDVHLVDDDDGGRRDNKLAWFAERDQSYANAALFGTVFLGR